LGCYADRDYLVPSLLESVHDRAGRLERHLVLARATPEQHAHA
jgi:hypothetical protein